MNRYKNKYLKLSEDIMWELHFWEDAGFNALPSTMEKWAIEAQKLEQRIKELEPLICPIQACKKPSPPVLIRLATETETKHLQTTKLVNKGQTQYTSASHEIIACVLGCEPCILLYPIPPKLQGHGRYVSPRDIIYILTHESIHHAIDWVQDDPLDDHDACHKTLDHNFPHIDDTAKLMTYTPFRCKKRSRS